MYAKRYKLGLFNETKFSKLVLGEFFELKNSETVEAKVPKFFVEVVLNYDYIV